VRGNLVFGVGPLDAEVDEDCDRLRRSTGRVRVPELQPNHAVISRVPTSRVVCAVLLCAQTTTFALWQVNKGDSRSIGAALVVRVAERPWSDPALVGCA